MDADTDSADWTDSADSTDSVDSADLADSDFNPHLDCLRRLLLLLVVALG